MTPEEFKKVARAVTLNLDNPESVKKQGARLVTARNYLKEYHAQIVTAQKSKKQPPFTVADLEDDPKLFERLMAIQEGSEEILDDATWLRLIIESLAIDCNKLIAKAKKYLSPGSAPAERPLAINPQPTTKTAQARPQAITTPTPSQPQPDPPAENKLDRWLSGLLTGLFGGQKRWWVRNWRVSTIAFFSLTAIGMFLEGTIGGIFGGLLCLGTAAVFAPKVAEWISGKTKGKIGPVLTRTAIAFLCLFLAGTLISGISGEPSQVATTNSQPSDPWVAAVDAANQALGEQQNATDYRSWNGVAFFWQIASKQMADIPSDHPQYATAQEKVVQYSQAAKDAIAARDKYPAPVVADPSQSSPSSSGRSPEELLKLIDDRRGFENPLEDYKVAVEALSKVCKMQPMAFGDLVVAAVNYLVDKEGMEYSNHELMREMLIFYNESEVEASCQDSAAIIAMFELSYHLEEQKQAY